ncbi:DUF1372 family protein [Streptococcus moroccensis]|uniref:Phage protein n=1 Tax=Streptococcus moroccensis TaxID=1451356 RepID=A0ABT9YPV4_9STRE|nr:DUF1372 family protein [Streptococcus moroccensis]MDQ0222008.1 hypothetical protein [Streptococcus moroccensis]
MSKKTYLAWFLITTLIYIMSSVSLVLNYRELAVRYELLQENQIIIYQVDNAGGKLVGTITEKDVVNGHYTVTIGAYGKFLVTREQFDSLEIGDEAPDYLKKRGS